MQCTGSSSPVISGNTFTGDSGGSGAGIYCSDRSSPVITSNTIAAANGDAIRVESTCSPAISNNIVAFSASGIRSAGAPTLRNNCVHNPSGPNYSGLAAGEGDISADPRLANLRVSEVHIQPDSPCRNAGWSGAPGLGGADIDGQPRTQGAAPDIGADESDGTTWPTVIAVVRVDGANGDDANDGSSWALAKKTVRSALGHANERGGEVWVKSGIYSEAVTVKTFVYLYGGFAGTEATRDERDWAANRTVLDGDGGSWTIIVSFTEPGYRLAAVDGFTVRGGSTGIQAQSWASPMISHNTVVGNSSGIYCSGSATIANNASIGNAGAGVYCAGPSVVTNNTIVRNSIGVNLYYDATSAVLSNNIIANNSSGVKVGAGTPTLRNNCVFNPGGTDYTGVQPGTGDVSADPKLPGVGYDSVHIQPDSPCRNAGWNDAPEAGSADIDGQARAQDGAIDIGADESDGTAWTANPLVVRVSPAGDDSNDGSTWALAKKTVQAGLNAASGSDGEVWVSAGVYSERVTMRPYTCLYGGFAGTETARSQRNWRTSKSILDGDSRGSTVTIPSGDSTVRIDGFTIRNGSSGGIYCESGSPTIANNTIVRNQIGVVCGSATPTIVGNTITGNNASTGGGIRGTGSGQTSGATISGNVISANNATSGGGIYWSGGAPIITNNTITANGASSGGGIYFEYGTSPKIYNNVIAHNSSGIHKTTTTGSDFSRPILRNNCVYNPDGADYANIAAGEGDISVAPGLVDAMYGGIHIAPDSPCRNAGLGNAPAIPATDIDGEERVQNGAVDIGADESDGAVRGVEPIVIRVSLDGDDANDGSGWQSAKKTIQAGIDAASQAGGEVWVKAGIYTANLSLMPFAYLYGGFVGDEADRSQRNWSVNKTVLQGDWGGWNNLVTVRGGSSYSTIDGFTIRGGASGVSCGISSATVANNTITSNQGNGVSCGSGRPVITNNAINGNGSSGINCSTSAAVITNNTITGNSGSQGAGVYFSYNSSPRISNNIIAFNRSGIYKNATSGTDTGNPVLRNNCVYNPDGPNYTGVQAGVGDISIDPKLAAVAYGEVHIQPDSPCRNAGWSEAPDAGEADTDHQARVQDGAIDIGADESDGTTWTLSPTIVRVSPTGDDSNDGSSWSSAKRTVQAGVNAASLVGGEVWVAAGVYSGLIQLRPYAYLYGGFTGTEAARSERDWALNRTVIDGGGYTGGVRAAIGHRFSALDGFIVQHCKSSGYGAVYCYGASPTVSNCTIRDNAATGVYCYTSAANVVNNIITGNAAPSQQGGGIECYSSSPTIAGNLITRNQGYGGGIYIYSAGGPTNITNNTIVLNTSNPGGAIICPQSSYVTLANNIMAFNTSGVYVRSYSPSGTPVLRNNCVYHPAGRNYDGISAGEGDISVDPLLSLDCHLSPISPCIDTGWSEAPGLPLFDLDGQSRANGAVDIGADEMWPTVGSAKAVDDTGVVSMSGVMVTAAFPGFFYVESTDRTCGIRVEKPDHGLSVGDRVDVSGVPETNADGERCIRATSAAVTGAGAIKPLGMTNRDLGGGTFGYQQGVWGWQLVRGEDGKLHRQWMQVGGLSVLGLLVSTAGRITETGAGWFRIDDGSDVGLRCILPDGVAIDPAWEYVSVTGIVSCERVGEELRGVLRLREREDVAMLQ